MLPCHVIGGAGVAFTDLTLDTYPGENISDFTSQIARPKKLKKRNADFIDAHEVDIPDSVDRHFDHEDLLYYFDADLEVTGLHDPFTFDDLLVDQTTVVCINQITLWNSF